MTLSLVVWSVTTLLGPRSPINRHCCSMVRHLAHLKSRLYRYRVVKASLLVRVIKGGPAPLNALHVVVDTVWLDSLI